MERPNERAPLDERRRRLRDERREQGPAERIEPAEKPLSWVSTVLAILSAAVLTLYTLVPSVIVLQSPGWAHVTGSGQVLLTFTGIAGMFSLIGVILLILRQKPGIGFIAFGSVVALLTIPVLLVIDSMPGHRPTASSGTFVGVDLFFGGLALIQVLRKNTLYLLER